MNDSRTTETLGKLWKQTLLKIFRITEMAVAHSKRAIQTQSNNLILNIIELYQDSQGTGIEDGRGNWRTWKLFLIYGPLSFFSDQFRSDALWWQRWWRHHSHHPIPPQPGWVGSSPRRQASNFLQSEQVRKKWKCRVLLETTQPQRGSVILIDVVTHSQFLQAAEMGFLKR